MKKTEDKVKHGSVWFDKPLFFRGRFVDLPQYKFWTQSQKDAADFEESFLIRYGESPTSNAVAKCTFSEHTKELAVLLNFGVKYEDLLKKYLELGRAYDAALHEIEKLKSEKKNG